MDMSTGTIILLSIIGVLFLLVMVGIFYGLPGLMQDYPISQEEEERKK